MSESGKPTRHGKTACLVIENDGDTTAYILIKRRQTALEYAELLYEVMKDRAGGIERIGTFALDKNKSGFWIWKDQFSEKSIRVLQMPIRAGTIHEVLQEEE